MQSCALRIGLSLLVLAPIALQPPNARAASDAGVPLCKPKPGQDWFCDLPGVRLHIVDWGGQGTPLILIPGFGDTARIYDDFAKRLTPHHRVIAITRRGFGRSVPTDTHVDVRTLAEDVIHLMDALKIARADLVGHSLAGNELSHLGMHSPARVRRLVYLDAAYDFSDALTLKDPAGSREPDKRALSNFDTLVAWREFELGSKTPAIAANARELYVMSAHGLVPRADAMIQKDILENATRFHPDYNRIEAPILALYASKTKLEQPSPAFSARDRELSIHYTITHIRPWMLAQKTRLEKNLRCGTATELPDTEHYLFIERPQLVANLVDDFLRDPHACSFRVAR